MEIPFGTVSIREWVGGGGYPFPWQTEKKASAHLVSRRPTLKKKGLVKLCRKFSVRNFDWMTFTGYISVMPTSIQPDPLEVIKA